MTEEMKTIVAQALLLTDQQKSQLLRLDPVTPALEQKIKFMVFLGNAIFRQSIAELDEQQKTAYEQSLQQIYKSFLSEAETLDNQADESPDDWLENTISQPL